MIGYLGDLDVVEAARAVQDRRHVRYPLPSEPALALAQALVGMALHLRRLLEPAHPAQRVGHLLAELGDEHPVNPVVAERIVEQLFVVVHRQTGYDEKFSCRIFSVTVEFSA